MYFFKEDELYQKRQIGKSEIIKRVNKNIISIFPKNSKILTNNVISIAITYKIISIEQQQYITDTTVNKSVDVLVNGQVQGTLDIVDGIGSFDFESAEPGTFVIQVESATCEVKVE